LAEVFLERERERKRVGPAISKLYQLYPFYLSLKSTRKEVRGEGEKEEWAGRTYIIIVH
jgi:hypothetical protein